MPGRVVVSAILSATPVPALPKQRAPSVRRRWNLALAAGGLAWFELSQPFGVSRTPGEDAA